MADAPTPDAAPSHGLLSKQIQKVKAFLDSLGDGDMTAFYGMKQHAGSMNDAEVIPVLKLLTRQDDASYSLRAALILLGAEPGSPIACDYLRRQLQSSHTATRFNIANIVGSLEEVAQPLHETFVKLYRGSNWICQVSAATALIRYAQGEANEGDHPSEAEIVHTLRQALRNDEPPNLYRSVVELRNSYLDSGEVKGCHQDPVSREMVEGMIGVLRDQAATALGRMGLHVREAVDALLHTLQTGDAEDKLRSVHLLFRLGKSNDFAERAIPAFLKLLNDPTTAEGLRCSLASVIGKMGEHPQYAAKLVAPLATAFQREDWLSASYLLDSMEAMGHLPMDALSLFIAQLEHEDPAARCVAAVSLGKFKEQGSEVVMALLDHATREPTRDVWERITDAIVSIGSPAIPHLIDWIVRGDMRVMPIVGESLMQIGPDCADPVLKIMVTHPDSRVRRYAASVLRQIGPFAAPVLDTVIPLLDSDDDDLVVDAIVILGNLQSVALDAVPRLVRFLEEPDSYPAKWATRALSAMGPSVAPVLEAELPRLSGVGRAAAGAIIGRFPPDASRPPRREVLSPTSVPGFEWLSDVLLLELFVVVVRILRECGDLSQRGIADMLADWHESGRINPLLPCREATVRGRLKKLEVDLKSRGGQPLFSSKSTRKAGLTAYGNDLFDRVQVYFVANTNKQ